MIPGELRYSKDHEWLQLAGRSGRIGITSHAQEALGDVVFVELPEVGRKLAANEAFGVVESVKAVSDCHVPVAGTVVAVNGSLADSPQLINQDPYGAGWIVEVELAEPADANLLLTASDYEQLLREEGV